MVPAAVYAITVGLTIVVGRLVGKSWPAAIGFGIWVTVLSAVLTGIRSYQARERGLTLRQYQRLQFVPLMPPSRSIPNGRHQPGLPPNGLDFLAAWTATGVEGVVINATNGRIPPGHPLGGRCAEFV